MTPPDSPRNTLSTLWSTKVWADRATWTARVYDLQHRLALTQTEATALLTLAGLLVLGLGVRAWQAHQVPFDDAFYAETDATFAALAGAPPALRLTALPSTGPVHAVAPDTARTAQEPPAAATPGEETDVASPRPRSTRAAAGPVRMNVNTASARLLDRLPGIGPALAGRILTYRAEHGDFLRAEDLVNVRGIGPKTYERLAPYVFVEVPPAPVAANVGGE